MMDFQSTTSQLQALIVAITVVCGAVFAARLKWHKDNKHIGDDRRDSHLMDNLRDQADRSAVSERQWMEEARKAWQAQTQSAVEIAVLKSDNKRLGEDLARLLMENAELRENSKLNTKRIGILEVALYDLTGKVDSSFGKFK